MNLFLFSQETGGNPSPGDERDELDQSRVCVFLHTNLSETDQDFFRSVITDALMVDLRAAGYSVVPRREYLSHQQSRGYSDQDMLAGPAAVEVAGAAGAGVAFTGFYRVEGEEIVFNIKGYHVPTGRLTYADQRSGEAGLDVYRRLNTTSDDLIPKLAQQVEPLPEESVLVEKEQVETETVYQERVVELGTAVDIVLYSPDEGADVLLAGEKPAGTIQNGRLEITGKAGTRLYLEIRKEGFHNRTVDYQVKEDRREIHLPPLMPVTKSAGVFTYSQNQVLGIGFGIRNYFVPDWHFFQYGGYFYMDYPFLIPSALPILHTDFSADAGTYLWLGPNSPVRLAYTMGLGAVLTYMPGTEFVDGLPVFLDLYWNFATVWIEWNMRHLTLMLGTSGKFAFELFDMGLLGTRHMGGEMPLIFIGVTWKW
ncbi:MAG: hypothetical protein K9L29_05180 [Spirochaetales bacterium]|nr:hypothetical protein [Spirochaetales bacterium]